MKGDNMTAKGRRQKSRGVGTEQNRRSERRLPSSGQQGDSLTRYRTDPFRGDKRAHSIAKKLRRGTPPRTIAKQLNVALSVVEDVQRKMAE